MKSKRTTKQRANSIPSANEKLTLDRATKSYEAWMRNCTNGHSVRPALEARPDETRPIPILTRHLLPLGAVWPSVCADLCNAPKVLAVGDLHVNSFGTWRDAEGRLCWGVDDFDEAYPLPYTNDWCVWRPASKSSLRAKASPSSSKTVANPFWTDTASRSRGGRPIVLAEREQKLGKLGVDSFKPLARLLEQARPAPGSSPPFVREREAGARKDSPRPQNGIQGSSSASRSGQPRPGAVCRHW